MPARRKRNLIDAVLSGSASGVCIVDEERRIRFFSPGLSRLTGWSAEEAEGLVCDPSAAPTARPLDLLASALAPSRNVLNGQTETTEVVLPRRDESGLRATLTFIPIQAEDGTVSRILVIHGSQQIDRSKPPSLTQQLHAEVTSLRVEFRRRFAEQSFLGQCPEIRRALTQTELLKNSDCGYSILGATGTGRRHLARMVHVAGHHHERSFVVLDCQLLSAEQVLDTLRQLRQNASDATAAPPHQYVGTLLFMDADRCPREVQTWILKDLMDRIAELRLVAVSSRSLAEAESQGWILKDFRQLFATLQVELPLLHHRGHDVSLLAQHFIEECRRTLETSAESMSPAVERELRFYRWPGNVGELRQVITEACQNSFATQLETDDLPFAFRAGLQAQQLPRQQEERIRSLEELMERFETDVLTRTLAACDGNKAEAARRLGMTRPRLYRRLRTLGLDEGEQ